MHIPAPSYTQTPNIFLDEMIKGMSEAEIKVALVIMRQTFGWHRQSKKMSLTFLMTATGLSRQGVLNGINAGMTRGIFTRQPDGDSYAYNLVVNEVDHPSQRSRPVLVNEVDPKKERKKGSKEKINPQAEKTEEDFDGLIHPDAKISPLVFDVLEKQWMSVNPAQLDLHMALVKKYGFENWLRGWEHTPPKHRSRKAYIEKVIITHMPDDEANAAAGFLPTKYGKNPKPQADGSVTLTYEGKTITVPEKWVHKLGTEAEQVMLSVLLTRQSLKHIPS